MYSFSQNHKALVFSFSQPVSVFVKGVYWLIIWSSKQNPEKNQELSHGIREYIHKVSNQFGS